MKKETSVYELLELIGDKFYIDILYNENIEDDVFNILEGVIIEDLEAILKKINHFKNISENNNK